MSRTREDKECLGGGSANLLCRTHCRLLNPSAPSENFIHLRSKRRGKSGIVFSIDVRTELSNWRGSVSEFSLVLKDLLCPEAVHRHIRHESLAGAALQITETEHLNKGGIGRQWEAANKGRDDSAARRTSSDTCVASQKRAGKRVRRVRVTSSSYAGTGVRNA